MYKYLDLNAFDVELTLNMFESIRNLSDVPVSVSREMFQQMIHLEFLLLCTRNPENNNKSITELFPPPEEMAKINDFTEQYWTMLNAVQQFSYLNGAVYHQRGMSMNKMVCIGYMNALGQQKYSTPAETQFQILTTVFDYPAVCDGLVWDFCAVDSIYSVAKEAFYLFKELPEALKRIDPVFYQELESTPKDERKKMLKQCLQNKHSPVEDVSQLMTSNP